MKTILVADDEFDLLSSIQAVLELEGYRVITCGNGQEALDRLQEFRPDLLITDVMMPHLSGLEVLQRMQGTDGLRDTPSVVMSAVKPAVKQKDYGWTVFLPKPFSIDQLLGAVNGALAAA